MKRFEHYLLICLAGICFANVALAQEEPIQVVQNGVLNEEVADIVGEPWQEADGFLEQQGTDQFLWAQPVIGPGDFHVTVELKLQEMFNDEGRGAAASFAINDMLQAEGVNGSNFGFVGGGGELFAEGNFFPDFITIMEETPIQEDTLFQLEFIREGDTYRFLLDGEEILSLPTPEEIGDPVFRSGFFRVGLRPWRSLMQVQTFTINSGAATFDPIEERIPFIESGVSQNAVEVGLPWVEADGSLENFDPGNFIFGDRPIFGSDYRVSARLAMEDIEGSAASFNINGDNNLGFSGGSGTMFTEGPFFEGAPSLEIEPPIEPNTFFDFEMISQDNKLRFLIDGQEILALDQPGEFVGFVGFRPWRSVMRISDFVVEPLAEEVIVPPDTVRTMPNNRPAVYRQGETIQGVQLIATVSEGQTSNAVITETLPEGWIADNLSQTNGTAEFSNGQLTWHLSDAQGTVELTYDLVVPSDSVSTRASFEGTVDTEGVDGRVTGFSELFLAANPNEEIFIVQDGQMTELAEVIGEPWSEVDGALERTGTGNFLLSDIAIADVNYEIAADLTLFGLGGTAVSINLRRVPDGAQSNFGFEGGSGTFFVEGPFFDTGPSFDSTTIEEGVPFTFQMVREGGSVDFMMDEQVIHTEPQEPGEAFRVGLRPWRSRMQVTNFVIRTMEETPVNNWYFY